MGETERQTQNRVVNLFRDKDKLDYTYLGNWEERENNNNVEEEILIKNLKKRGYSESLIQKALFQFTKETTDLTNGLFEANKRVYNSLRYGIKVKEGQGEQNQTVWLIDWKNILNNEFAIAEEVTVKGQDYTKRPDIVIYVNGIALGVLELKNSRVSTTEGIRQNLSNQNKTFIEQFFTTMQFVMAGNDTEGLKYGTIETKPKYYLTWKEKHYSEEDKKSLDKHLLDMFNKERFLELIHDFIVYDRGIKKLCRHNQYFGVKAAQKELNKKEGGIIWHSQGSGKSLTMVWLAKWVLGFNPEARVLIITDRIELDEQIEKVFNGVEEKITRTKNSKELANLLKLQEHKLMCSLIHKFGRKKENEGYDKFFEEIIEVFPEDFRAVGELYVFVDECHRTQSGKLHKAMKKVLPNAVFVGFTGTPLLKTDKKTSIETFGPYIHTYKFDEAVADEVILDLRYEARDVDQKIRNQEKIDQWFEAKTKGLTESAKTELKKRWGTLQKVLSSKERLDRIVQDVYFDMNTQPRLQNGRGNAMLVSPGIYEACKYYELFQKMGFKNCAIITSYYPTAADIRLEDTGEYTETEKAEIYRIYKIMLGDKNAETFEKEIKEQFINEPAKMKLLIVVDKLLTGFDAPPATYLYIDKSMRDHGLFQAICRVNRLDGNDKPFGYIIDYKDLFKSVEKSIKDYTREAFDNFVKEDVQGLIKDKLDHGKEKLEQYLELIRALCEPVREPKDYEAYCEYFNGESPQEEKFRMRRESFYRYTSSLLNAYMTIANEMVEAGYSREETRKIEEEVRHYKEVRDRIKLSSGDYVDLKLYEPGMRQLIDMYIQAEDSKVISNFDDLSLIDLIVKKGQDAVDDIENLMGSKPAAAESIVNNLRRVINDSYMTNPKYFEKMSAILDELVQLRKEMAIEYEEYINRLVEQVKNAKSDTSGKNYPPGINTKAKQALYDNLNQDEDLAIRLHHVIMTSKMDNWRGPTMKKRKLRNAIEPLLGHNSEEVDRIFKIIESQSEY